MRYRAVGLVLLLASCASAGSQQDDDNSPGEFNYGGLRNPFPVEQAQPTIPPQHNTEPAPPPKSEAPKVDPCARACAAHRADDQKCDRLLVECQRMFQAQGHMNGETCKESQKVCSRVTSAKTNLAGIGCECE